MKVKFDVAFAHPTSGEMRIGSITVETFKRVGQVPRFPDQISLALSEDFEGGDFCEFHLSHRDAELLSFALDRARQEITEIEASVYRHGGGHDAG